MDQKEAMLVMFTNSCYFLHIEFFIPKSRKQYFKLSSSFPSLANIIPFTNGIPAIRAFTEHLLISVFVSGPPCFIATVQCIRD